MSGGTGAAEAARHERNADATKRRLLVAAEIEFAAKGYDGARLGNIARAAGAQQALIHHYFGDKEGLYREVLRQGLAAAASGSWGILERLGDEGSLVELVTSFIELLVDFYATHRALLAILRHEGHAGTTPEDGGGGHAVHDMMALTVRPIFEAAAGRLEKMKDDGEVGRAVDVRHLLVSALAMACYPFQEERLLRVMWPVDWTDPAFLAQRKREIVATVLARARGV